MKRWFNGIPFTGLPSSVEVGGVKFWFNGVPLDSMAASATVAYVFMQPSADSIDGTWTNQAGGSELFSVLDEAATDDADYIQSIGSPASDVCKIKLSNPTTTPGQPFIVAYRYRKSGTAQIDLTVRLLEGTTQIAAWSHTNIVSTFVTGEQTLSGAQFSAIGDFNNLFIEFNANNV
jgi:hypothetical protein